ncbi:hypothetical protein TRVL_02562 [Trypanosoma vivax]|nr:hypothetical protein TRVL_02562 [Trypanosoma vivax]
MHCEQALPCAIEVCPVLAFSLSRRHGAFVRPCTAFHQTIAPASCFSSLNDVAEFLACLFAHVMPTLLSQFSMAPCVRRCLHCFPSNAVLFLSLPCSIIGQSSGARTLYVSGGVPQDMSAARPATVLSATLKRPLRRCFALRRSLCVTRSPCLLRQVRPGRCLSPCFRFVCLCPAEQHSVPLRFLFYFLAV